MAGDFGDDDDKENLAHTVRQQSASLTEEVDKQLASFQ